MKQPRYTVETTNGVLVAVWRAQRAFAVATANAYARTHGVDAVVRHRDRVIHTARAISVVRRRACDCPATCEGPERHRHSIKCRPARPACRWRRRERGLCQCPAYHWPHRDGSGRCVTRDGGERYETYLRTARRRAA